MKTWGKLPRWAKIVVAVLVAWLVLGVLGNIVWKAASAKADTGPDGYTLQEQYAFLAMIGSVVTDGPNDGPYDDATCGGTVCAAGKHCKTGLRNYVHESYQGADDWRAWVDTNWCWQGGQIVSRHSVPVAYTTTWGDWLLEAVRNTEWRKSQCAADMSTCVTWREVDVGCCVGHIWVQTTKTCIETRIYAGGGHNRAIRHSECQ